MMKNLRTKSGGYLLVQVLVFGAIAVIIIGGLITFAAANIKLGRRVVLSEQAFQLAEAGLEYYRWHLAHAPADYTNGTGLPGPYIEELHDTNGNLVGSFSLDIQAPPLGSTLVTIRSTGIPAADPTVRRTILSRLAVPSFANFAVAANSFMRFGPGTEIFGPIHSNNGIRFDGLAHNLVTSALTYFDDPGHSESGGQRWEFAVHTHVDPPPGSGVNDAFRPLEAPCSPPPSNCHQTVVNPNPVQPRPDVFRAGRSFPAPTVEFSGITTDIAQMKTDAQANGFYRATSTAAGFLVSLGANGNFNLYRVNSVQSNPSGCTAPTNPAQPGWGTWSIASTTLIGTYAYPGNGLMFFEDHLWVEGQIDGQRLTIVAATIPDISANLRRSITINNNLLYTNYDGTDVIALIAQDNINAGLQSADNLRIDAALIAQNGRVGRYSYSATQCGGTRNRASITLYGTIITAQQYGFAYVGSSPSCSAVGNGYCLRNITYDAFLLYTPPPFFPRIEDFHEVIFWKEV